ncbi:MAG: iron ABC transporter permease [Pseudomonadota bacterium]|nr:iron ABC transporter permease [Pseudomonadota bacterium]
MMALVLNAPRITLSATVALLLVIGAAPLLAMFVASMTIDDKLSLVHYQELLSSHRAWALLAQSLMLSSLTALCGTVLGVPLGVLFGKTDLPLRHLFVVLFTLPLLLPPYLLAVAWSAVLGREGWLSEMADGGLAAMSSAWLFGLPGCVLVLTTVFMPIAMLLTIAYLKTVDPRLEEAGRLIARRPRVLFGITLPLIRPGLAWAALLIFLLTVGEFSVPMTLRYAVFPVEILTQFSAFYDFGAATAAAVPLALLTVALLVIEWRIARAPRPSMRGFMGSAEGSVIRLGAARVGWCLTVGLICLVLVIVPVGGLVLQTSPTDYVDALGRAGDSLVRSLLYAAIGATLLAVLGFFCGYLVHTRALRAWRGVDFLTLLLLVLPAPVIGMGLISLWNRPATDWIYGTPAMILIGYLAQYLALTSRTTAATLAQIPRSMDEAAAVTGAGWFRRLSMITIPLARPGLLAAWLIAYLFCLRDTGIAMLVYPPGHDTLPVRIFTLMANSPEGLIAALCVLMMIATFLPLAALGLIMKRWRLAL